MKRALSFTINGGITTGALLAGAVVLLALPSAVLAFATRYDNAGAANPATNGNADGVGLVPGMALRSLARGPLYPFTPAGMPNRPTRSVTVAVRVDAETARAIYVRGPRLAPATPASTAPAPVRIASTAFNLGVSRGYRSFAQGLTPPADGADSPGIVPGIAPTSARLSPRIGIDDGRSSRASRGFAGDAAKGPDTSGSFRVIGNLNVTTGSRYAQDRERLRPLTDGNSDSQAVYVGTQIRF